MVVIWQQLKPEELELLQRLAAGRALPDGSQQFERLWAEDLVIRDGTLTPYGHSLLSTMNA